jgi:hypothetical protein
MRTSKMRATVTRTNSANPFVTTSAKIRGDMSLMMAFQNWVERA